MRMYTRMETFVGGRIAEIRTVKRVGTIQRVRHQEWCHRGDMVREMLKSMKRRRVQVSCDRKPAIDFSVSEKEDSDHDVKKSDGLDSIDSNGAVTPMKRSKSSWETIAGVFSAFVLCNLDKVNMSVAIIPMSQEFGWTAAQKGLVQSSFFWGYTLTQIPGGWFANKIGGRTVLLAGVFFWSLGTFVGPWSAMFSLTALCVSRLIVGLGEGVAPPSATAVIAKAVPLQRRSRAVTLAFGGLDVGSFVGLLIAPTMIIYFGWPSVFYSFAILGFIWCFYWAKYHPEPPKPSVASSPITSEKSGSQAKMPWTAFLRSKAVWAIIVAHFTWNWFYYTLLAWLPSFFESALNLNLTNSSFLSILPYISTVVSTAFVGVFADALVNSNSLTVTQVRKLCQSIGFLGPMICLVGIGFVLEFVLPDPSMNRIATSYTVLLMSMAFAFGSFTRAGLFCNHQDLSPKYASVLLGITNTAAAVGSVLGTAATGLLLQQTSSWVKSLIIPVCILQVISTMIWCIYASGVPIDFDEQKQS